MICPTISCTPRPWPPPVTQAVVIPPADSMLLGELPPSLHEDDLLEQAVAAVREQQQLSPPQGRSPSPTMLTTITPHGSTSQASPNSLVS